MDEADKEKRRSEGETTQDSNEKKEKGKSQAQEPDPSPTRTMHDLNVRMTLNNAGHPELANGTKLDPAAIAQILQAKDTRKRVVCRIWPRDPKGKYITPENSRPGKMTSNGVQLWGATTFDFYHVRRIPTLGGLVTTSTGSKLAAWMKANGELEHAAPEIAWAEEEEKPRQVPPCEVGSLIEPTEDRIRWGMWGKSMPLVDEIEKEGKEAGKEKTSNSFFDTSTYPAPWPLIPFSYSAPTIQDYIPLHRLPKKLIVHDPWSQLSVSEYDHEPTENADWTKTPDVTHVYTLKLSPEAIKRLEAEEKEKEANEQEKGPPSGFLMRPVDKDPGPIEPPIFVVYPPDPPVEPIEEAHLYISPAHTAGKGNHSVLYHAELEVPRSTLMGPRICTICISEDVEKILTEEDGEDGSRKDPRWKEKSATLKKVQHTRPPVTIKVVNGQGDTPQETDDDKDVYTMDEGETYDVMEFEGPVRQIHTRVPWQSPDAPYTTKCQHQDGPNKPHPATTRVSVVAKLSLEHDMHLANEAGNYQKFPKHMFEHWNGFNILPPLHDPTPVGALVPQFYGYYVPEGYSDTEKSDDAGITASGSSEDGSNSTDEDKSSPYLSPILLMEDCGVPLDPSDLSIDDKNECRSLYYRLHHAGWVHGSVARRNILVQRGPLSVPPFYRQLTSKKELSFRLIDFGRSYEIGDSWADAIERMDVGHMFGDYM